MSDSPASTAQTTRPQESPPAPVPVSWLLAAAFILTIMVGVVSAISLERHEAAMTRLLAEKGDSLIRAFESILRSGMRSQMGLRLQVLLEEMSASKDIRFIAVTMPDGTIVAHSNPARLGEILQEHGREMDEERVREWRRQNGGTWRITNMEGGRAFVIFQDFTPVRGQLSPHLPQPVIFLGLDVSPFESSREQDRTQAMLMGLVILLVGLACLVALYYAQRASESRTRQRLAEGQVRALEEEVRRKEKLAAVGTLAAGVAHEIRNPLSSIKGYATYFGQRFPEGSEDREAAHVMVREVDRLNRVITDLIGLARPTDVRVRPARLEEAAGHALQLLRQDAEQKGIRMRLDVPPDMPEALIDPDRIKQALLNLCLNAFDAMPDGGTLTLRIRPEGSRLRMAVQDSGEGIPPDMLQNVFNPYFTTKGRGTGLGLAIVHKIVEAHGGEISVASRQASAGQSGGTTFTIWLPAARR
ncbi:MAG: two-component system sensor histidine kinase ZraS [Desulfovibrionaceae bacterium]|nr:two-component system sensor histidine kinase ZraS [Desulfovibrionaceae bacterium]